MNKENLLSERMKYLENELALKNRELEIEASLERVRSRSLAMHKSDDLQEVVTSVLQRLNELGLTMDSASINLPSQEKQEFMVWIASKNHDYSEGFRLPFGLKSVIARDWDYINVFSAETDHFFRQYSKEEKDDYYRELFEHSDFRHIPQARKDFLMSGGKYGVSGAVGKYSTISTFSYSGKTLNSEEIEVLKRFLRVFEQAYVRFLDLQKAEAQAREAQIEAALEKVRARTMGMQNSSELKEAAALLFQQVQALGVPAFSCGYNIWEKGAKECTAWMTSADGRGIDPAFKISLTEDPNFVRFYESKQKGEDFYVLEMRGEIMQKHYKYLRTTIPVFDETFIKIEQAGLSLPDTQIHHLVNFDHGNLMFITLEPCPEAHDIFKRFGKVFQQTYTRFLDLQKAEAQAKEAQLEAALERVRSKTIGMQRSDKLKDAALLLFQQIEGLGLPPFACGFNIWDDDRKAATAWMGSVGGLQPPFKTDSSMDVYLPIYEAAQRGDSLFLIEQSGKELEDHYDYLATIPTFRDVILENFKRAGISVPTYQIIHCAYFKQGYLMFISYEPVPAYYDIFKRFAKVFEQTYTRFLDLQKAEMQAKEAIKASSLDRVRGEIASMRTVDDLQRITPIIWHELNALGVPFVRCGVFIMNEATEHVQVHLSAPDGHSLGLLDLPFNSSELTINSVNHWRQGIIFKTHWNKQEFLDFMHSMIKEGQVLNPETYQGAAAPPESLDLNFVPFKQGMLYVGNSSPLEIDELQLVKSLAESFSIAYARYEDFRQLEEAKNQIEKTYTELKAAQSQLIQSEKMASLGELTAGIAHEIQNPLNFVNNFSEVNKELLLEMNDEIEKGNLIEVKAIAKDVIENEEKINHHGKRADAIVKGMLQHSRTSNGLKEPTDINALADEYLRLSYHGLRAKDKSFNATLKTDFDENIGNINIVPQDIGRVILNLITNAFYVVDEKKKLIGDNYEPIVSVITKKMNDKVLISVKDNGSGIPQRVLDKIFQPFFTTKPTGEGTGLGLSMSYDIITKGHGGELSVETVEGEGSVFVIGIPI